MIRLVVLDGPGKGQRLPLSDGEHIAGREPTCSLYLASRRVSRKHARFLVRGDECVVQDMGSANGVLVNGHRMESCALVHGTQVQLGDVLMVFQVRETTDAIPEDPADALPTNHGDQPLAQGGFMAFGGGATMEMDLDQDRDGGLDLELDEEPPPAPFGGGGPAFGGGPPPPGELSGPQPGLEPTGTVPRIEPGPAPTAPGPEPVGAGPSPAAPGVHSPAGGPLEQIPWLVRALVPLLFAALILMCGPFGGFTWVASSTSDQLQALSVSRGAALAEGLGHRNAQALANRKHLLLDVAFIEDVPGVESARVLDSDGDVVAPSNKMNESWRSDELWKRSDRSGHTEWESRDGYTVIVAPIEAATTEGGGRVLVGYAVLEYDTVGVAGEVGSPWLRWVASGFWMMVALGVVLGGAWFLALRPLGLLRDEIEVAMKNAGQLAPSSDSPQQVELVHTVNRLLRRAAGMPEPAQPAQPQPQVVEKVVERVVEGPPDGRLHTLVAACTFPVFLLDEQARVTETNDWGAHLAGLPQASLVGTPIVDVFSEPGASDRLRLMIDGVLGGQAPVLADRFSIAGQERQVTLSGGDGHMTLVVL